VLKVYPLFVILCGIFLPLISLLFRAAMLHARVLEPKYRAVHFIDGCLQVYTDCVWIVLFSLALEALTFSNDVVYLLRYSQLAALASGLLTALLERNRMYALPGVFSIMTLPFFETAFSTPIFIVVLIAMLAFEAADSAYRCRQAYLREKSLQTTQTIREGLDAMPHGFLFCERDGRLLLVNKVMEELSMTLCRKVPENGNTFWSMLSEVPSTALVTRVDGDDSFLFRFAGGNVWSLYRKEILIRGKDAFQIVALNITESEDIRRRTSHRKSEAEHMKPLAEEASEMVWKAAQLKEETDELSDIYTKGSTAIAALSDYLGRRHNPELMDPEPLERSCERLISALNGEDTQTPPDEKATAAAKKLLGIE